MIQNRGMNFLPIWEYSWLKMFCVFVARTVSCTPDNSLVKDQHKTKNLQYIFALYHVIVSEKQNTFHHITCFNHVPVTKTGTRTLVTDVYWKCFLMCSIVRHLQEDKWSQRIHSNGLALVRLLLNMKQNIWLPPFSGFVVTHN